MITFNMEGYSIANMSNTRLSTTHEGDVLLKSNTNLVAKFKRETNTFQTVATVTSSTGFRIALEDHIGNIYTATYTSAIIEKITPDGTVTTLATLGTGLQPQSMVIDKYNNLIISVSGPTFGRRIYRVNQLGQFTYYNIVEDIAPSFLIKIKDDIYMLSGNVKGVYKLDENLVPNLIFMYPITKSYQTLKIYDDHIYMADIVSGTRSLDKYDLEGNLITSYITSFDRPHKIEVDSKGNKFIFPFSNISTNKIGVLNRYDEYQELTLPNSITISNATVNNKDEVYFLGGDSKLYKLVTDRGINIVQKPGQIFGNDKLTSIISKNESVKINELKGNIFEIDVSSVHSYFINEIKTGQFWIDGKPIYTITKLTTDPVPTNIETQFPNIIVGDYTIYKYTKTT